MRSRLYACTGAGSQGIHTVPGSGKTRCCEASTARFRAIGACFCAIGRTHRQPGRALYSAPSACAPEKSHLRDMQFRQPDIDESPTHAGSPICTSRKPSPYRQKRRENRRRRGSRKTSPQPRRFQKSQCPPILKRELRMRRPVAHSPEKPHLSPESIRTTIACQVPKSLTCAEKKPAQTVSPSSIGGLSSRSGYPLLPQNLTCDHFSGKFRSRKRSPVATLPACFAGPEKPHLKPVEPGLPPFRSRKTSPFGVHRLGNALLRCKTPSVSRKSSHQIGLESRGISPFAKSA